MLEGVVLLVFVAAVGYVIFWSIQNDDLDKEIELGEDAGEPENTQPSNSGRSIFKDRVK